MDRDHIAEVLMRGAFRGDEELMAHSLRLGDAAVTGQMRAVALLHDVIEDTEITADMLRLLIDDDIVDSVEILTRTADETYAEYIRRIQDSHDFDAIMVKRIDLLDHLDSVRIDALSESMIKRYRGALVTLG